MLAMQPGARGMVAKRPGKSAEKNLETPTPREHQDVSSDISRVGRKTRFGMRMGCRTGKIGTNGEFLRFDAEFFYRVLEYPKTV
jgi:hypothetical protein